MERSRLRSVVVDCARPAALARFWAEILGYRLRPYDEAELARLRAAGIEDLEDDPSVAIDPPGEGPTIWFDRVPEGKVVKNRVHLDVRVGPERVDAEVSRLTARGATVLHRGQQGPHTWVTIADPEGNELCLT